MTRILLSFLISFFLSTHFAAAQERPSWIQLESHPSLAVTQQAIRAYGTRVEDVNGFSLGAGWYAVALGPYPSQNQADRVMADLQDRGLIPRDSYVAANSDFQQQFWPVGANFLDRPALEMAQADTDTGTGTDTATDTGTQSADPARPEIVPDRQIPRETVNEARQSEARLSRQQKLQLQDWLKSAGHYAGALDAVIGPGTRAAMSSWQRANDHEATGVMTTRQRDQLRRQFNIVLEGLGLRRVRDAETGIEIRLPLDVVGFDRYQPPFAHFTAKGPVPQARVLLISQPGDRTRMVALYDIMQTLRIVPKDGPREIDGNSFSLTGRNDRIVSHTEASVENGRIKGFTLVWPAGDEERRTRLLDEMRASFTRLDGVLDPAAGAAVQQSVDLVSGLEIRQPKLSRSGFYVDRSGTVVTTLEAVQGCERITLDEDYEASVVTVDNALGIAVLRPDDPLAPIAVAEFQQVPPQLQSDVAVSGYSYGGVLGAPTLTFGQLAAARGLDGSDKLKRLALNALEGDAGGPVVDSHGAVLGMLLPAGDATRKLPEGVSFAADAQALRALLEGVGVVPASVSGGEVIPPETLSKRTSGMTVLVSCWE